MLSVQRWLPRKRLLNENFSRLISEKSDPKLTQLKFDTKKAVVSGASVVIGTFLQIALIAILGMF